jgi:transcriptional regulator with GAF, ATPase, and Fis domain
MTGLLKDRVNISLILAVMFFAGILASLYVVYSLPHQLMLRDGYQSEFANVFIVLGVTFAIGALNIWYGARHKNEVIVYRDKQTDKTSGDNDTSDSNQTTISLETVTSSVSTAKETKEILHAGLHAICKQIDAGQGAVYLTMTKDGKRKVELTAGYALSIGESNTISFDFGEGLIGQAAAGGSTLYIDEVPEGYIKIISGLGSASPQYLLIVPMKKNNQVIGVMEIASFTPISEDQRKFVEESAQIITEAISGN